MRKVRKKERVIFLFGIILLDQISKLFFLKSGIGFINKGISFGILLSHYGVILLICFLLLLGLLVSSNFAKKNFWFQLVLAGGLSNLLDRVFRGGVVDFISFWFFPSFNLADIVIVVGVTLLSVDLLKSRTVS